MRRIDRYLLGTFLELLSITMLLLTFIMLLFDVFSTLEQYMKAECTLMQIMYSTLLFVPEAVSFTLPPSALFASTYMLSIMYANNEMIVLAVSGYSFSRITTSLIITALLLTSLFFAFNEQVTRQFKVMKEEYTSAFFDSGSSAHSSRLVLTDESGEYILYARRFDERTSTLSYLSLIILDENGQFLQRYDARRAEYQEGRWTAEHVLLYDLKETRLVETSDSETLVLPRLDLEPDVIAQRAVDIDSMDLMAAYRYIERLRKVNNPGYTGYSVDFYQRLSMNFAPLILILISCATVIPWKKNVLVLSIITSISIAVVYYVLVLSGTILARQEIVEAGPALFVPPAVLIAIASGILIIRRK